jgi:dTDP-4-dehydrorhamnose reductase
MSHKLLITGALGQLGSAVRELLRSDFEILATDINNPTEIAIKDDYLKLDITDTENIQSVIKRFDPDILLNLAAFTDVDGCEKNPDLAQQINFQGVAYLIQEFHGLFVQISTDYVFDGDNGPYSEDDVTNPINVYGQTKSMSERVIAGSKNPWVILRTNVLYDTYSGTRASFINWIRNSLNKGESIHVVTDQWNNPIWTNHMVEIIQIIIQDGLTGLFHCGGRDYVNRFEFANKVAEIFGLNKTLIKPISTSDLDQTAPRPYYGGLVTDKVESMTNLSMHTLDEALTDLKKRMES